MKTNERTQVVNGQFTLYSTDGSAREIVNGWVGITSHNGIFIAAVDACQFHVIKTSRRSYKRLYDGCYTSISTPEVCTTQNVPGKLLLQSFVTKGTEGQLLITFEKDVVTAEIQVRFGNVIKAVA